MPDNPLTCADARRQLPAYLAGEPYPSVTAHLAACPDCREACIACALGEPLAVTVPRRFAAQVIAQLPAEQPERSWAPVAAVVLFALLGVIICWRGDGVAVAQTLLRWEALAVIAVVETAVALAWALRATTRQE